MLVVVWGVCAVRIRSCWNCQRAAGRESCATDEGLVSKKPCSEKINDRVAVAAQSNPTPKNQMSSLLRQWLSCGKNISGWPGPTGANYWGCCPTNWGFAKRFNQVLQTLNQWSLEPSISLPQQFSEEYPQTGVSYEVRAGDIERDCTCPGSTIKWIQKHWIANPARDLKVGQTIFIPIKK